MQRQENSSLPPTHHGPLLSADSFTEDKYTCRHVKGNALRKVLTKHIATLFSRRSDGSVVPSSARPESRIKLRVLVKSRWYFLYGCTCARFLLSPLLIVLASMKDFSCNLS